MRFVMWIFRLLLFFMLFGFAVKNDHLVVLQFFFGSSWQLPLVFVILAAFTAGALLGVTATFASLLRQRREIGKLRKQLQRAERKRPTEAGVPTSTEVQAPETF
ncbi:MAG TPA: LapA family protein [Aromatoleum sp.]|uniref:LapA family protein n=1 Tax=Aromatoleum sp. TaxID=2307007 RepID=UPI002B491AB2|nr:LapA family protein [Aromatoleum sp.]HJV28289.1 LapA family protein [Aromatoleum sp.]